MKLPEFFTKVTPLSKILAGVLFILLPFLGFFTGIKYQQIQPEKIQYIPEEKIIKIPIEDDINSLNLRCGDIPVKAHPEKEHFDSVIGPIWAPDCRHIAWSLWESGTSYGGNDPKIIEEIENNPRVLSGREGVFIHNDSSKTTTKIYNPTKLNETPTLIKWEDGNYLVFEANNIRYSYNLLTGKTSVINE